MKKESILKERILLFPLTIILFILPFIIRMKPIELNGGLFDYWIGDSSHNDFFSYYKKMFLYIMALLSCLTFFLATPRIKRNIKVYIAIILFGILTALSAISSSYPEIVYGGFVDKSEGLWVICAYLFLIIYAMNAISTQYQYRILRYIFISSGIIISLLAIIQYLGFDFYSLNFVRAIMVPSEYSQYKDAINFNFGKGFAYSIFYNPNYLGGYLSFFVPFTIGYSVYTQNLKEKTVCALAGIIGIAAILASKSEAGLLGAIIGGIYLGINFVIQKYGTKDKILLNSKNKIYILIPLIIVMVGLAINFNSKQEITNLKQIGPLNNIEKLSKNKATFTIENKTIFVEIDMDKLNIKDENNNLLYDKNLLEEGEATIEFEPSKLTVTNSIAIDREASYYPIEILVKKFKFPLYFLAYQGEIFVTDYKYYEINPRLSKQFGFNGLEKIGSARGYIWSRTLPLLSENLLIGSGPGTFVTRFPQEDIYAKQFAYQPKDLWIQIDKPHNLYLEVAIQSGILALIIIIMGIAYIYLYNEKRKLPAEGIKRFDEYILKSALFGFLISSIFNDSTLGVTPIIMIFVGILLSFKMLDTK